jgi:hypothetical protein
MSHAWETFCVKLWGYAVLEAGLAMMRTAIFEDQRRREINAAIMAAFAQKPAPVQVSK